jgi:hypothetical protein
MQKCISKQLISTSNSIIAKCEPELSVVEEQKTTIAGKVCF